MKIEVRAEGLSADELRAIAIALGDRVTRAHVIVTGILMQLPDDRARRRVLAYVSDRLEQEQGAQ